VADALAYSQSAIEVNPSLSKVLDHSAKPFLTYSWEESHSEDEKVLFSAVSLTPVNGQLSPPSPVPVLNASCVFELTTTPALVGNWRGQNLFASSWRTSSSIESQRAKQATRKRKLMQYPLLLTNLPWCAL
jgi:hypothetical protein